MSMKKGWRKFGVAVVGLVLLSMLGLYGGFQSRESWLMTKERAYFEVTALKEHGQFCPEHVPEVYYFDRGMALFAMRYLEPPHIIMRKGLIAGVEYPLLAEHISDYMAKTLFHTSLLYLSTTEHKAEVARFCSNVEMCRLTEQVIFSDPYMLAANNRWSSPYLDEDAKALQEDNQLKVEIAELKSKFCERTQALIHEDLHTDSVMVTSSSTQVIDPEFAFYGPIGFDIGAFIGNLILAFFSQDGHGNSENQRKVKNPTARVEHEASTSKIGEDQLFYFQQRGIDPEKAVAAIINGFCRVVFNELPLEFAAEVNQLMSLKLEGSVG